MAHEQYLSPWHERPLEEILRRKLPPEAFAVNDEITNLDAHSIGWRIWARHPQWADSLTDEDVELCIASRTWGELGKRVKDSRTRNRVKSNVLNADLDALTDQERDDINEHFFFVCDEIDVPFARIIGLNDRQIIPGYAASRYVEHKVHSADMSIDQPEVQDMAAYLLHFARQKYETTVANETWWKQKQAYGEYRSQFLEVSEWFLVQWDGKGHAEYRHPQQWVEFLRDRTIHIPVLEPLSDENETHAMFHLITRHSQELLPIFLQIDNAGLFDGSRTGDALGSSPHHDVLSTRDLTFLALALQKGELDEKTRGYMEWRISYGITRGVLAEWKKAWEVRCQILASVLGVELEIFKDEKLESRRMTRQDVAELYERIARHFIRYEDMAERILTNFAVPCAMRDELLCYTWAVWVQFHPDQQEAAADYLLPHLDGQGWSTTQAGGFGAVLPDRWGKPYHLKIDSPEYHRRLKGEGFYTQDYDSLIRRRYPFSTSLEFPWTYETGISHGQGCSFSEYFLAHRLLAIDAQLAEASSIQDAMRLIEERTAGIESPARDTYIEYFLREALLNDTLETPEDVERAILYFERMRQGSRNQSALAPLLLRRYMDVDPDFFADFEQAVSRIVYLLPGPCWARNKALRRLETSRPMSPDQIHIIRKLYVDDLALSESETKARGLEVSFFELISGLDMKGKKDLLCWLLDEKQPKPVMLQNLEKNMYGHFDDLRMIFYSLSDTEQASILQRIIVGPEGIFQKGETDNGTEAFAQRLSEVLIQEGTGQVRAEQLQELFSIGLLSVSPTTVSRVLSNIANRISMRTEDGETVTSQEILYVAISSFHASGIKAVQLIADYPWVDPQIRAVFQEGMYNAARMTPSEIMDVWEMDKVHFPGFEIVEFVKPLGSASMRQSYLLRMKFPDSSEHLVVLKCAKLDIIDFAQIDKDIADIQAFTANLEKRGYLVDLPVDFGHIIGSVVTEERDTAGQVTFQLDYREAQLKEKHASVYVPEVYGIGRFIVAEEYIKGELLGNSDVQSEQIHHIIARAAYDLLSTGMIHIDPHAWNIIHGFNGKNLTYLDFGMKLDLRSMPEAQRALVQVFYGLILSNTNLFSQGLQFFGITPETQGEFHGSLQNKIEVFRKIINLSTNHDTAVVLHKLLWWMYRLQAHFERLTPEDQAILPDLLVGGWGTVETIS